MVVDDSHLMLRAIFPSENNSPLLIDTNAPEACQIPLQLFKSVAGRNPEILNDSGLIDHSEFAPGPFLNIARQAPDSQATVDVLGV